MKELLIKQLKEIIKQDFNLKEGVDHFGYDLTLIKENGDRFYFYLKDRYIIGGKINGETMNQIKDLINT